MATKDELREKFASMNPDEFAKFRSAFGGSGSDGEYYVRSLMENPSFEPRICDLLGLKTEQEKINEATLARLKMDSPEPKVPKNVEGPEVLLTWSGDGSHTVASFLFDWLKEVVPGIGTWISDESIEKGKGWFRELMTQLDRTRILIACVTPENVKSPWVYYEVGVVAGKLEEANVCPYLVGVDGKLVKDTPLGTLQWTQADKTDTFRLIRTINKQLGDRAHNENVLSGNFNSLWPKLKRQIDKVVEKFDEIEDEIEEVAATVDYGLSNEARELLLEACKDERGAIRTSDTMGGTEIETGERTFCDTLDARTIALWRSALSELTDSELVDDDENEFSYHVTRKGFEYADTLVGGEPKSEST